MRNVTKTHAIAHWPHELAQQTRASAKSTHVHTQRNRQTLDATAHALVSDANAQCAASTQATTQHIKQAETGRPSYTDARRTLRPASPPTRRPVPVRPQRCSMPATTPARGRAAPCCLHLAPQIEAPVLRFDVRPRNSRTSPSSTYLPHEDINRLSASPFPHTRQQEHPTAYCSGTKSTAAVSMSQLPARV